MKISCHQVQKVAKTYILMLQSNTQNKKSLVIGFKSYLIIEFQIQESFVVYNWGKRKLQNHILPLVVIIDITRVCSNNSE